MIEALNPAASPHFFSSSVNPSDDILPTGPPGATWGDHVCQCVPSQRLLTSSKSWSSEANQKTGTTGVPQRSWSLCAKVMAV